MTEHPTPPEGHPRIRPADQPPSVDSVEAADPPAEEAERQAQETVRSISRLEESN